MKVVKPPSEYDRRGMIVVFEAGSIEMDKAVRPVTHDTTVTCEIGIPAS